MAPQLRAVQVRLVEADDDGRSFAACLADALRRGGYDAHPFNPDSGVIGVQIRAVHVDGWRYPNGHWEFHDQPVHIVAEKDRDGERSWVWVDHHRELSVPSFGSPAAVADWIIHELPAPEHLTCRLGRHPDLIDSDSAAIPTDWYAAWAQGDTP